MAFVQTSCSDPVSATAPLIRLPCALAERLSALKKFGGAEPLKVTLVRPPIFYHKRSLSNEATPSLAMAYISSYLLQHHYTVHWVDGIGEGLNRHYPSQRYPDYRCQGLTVSEIVARIPADTEVIGVSALFSSEWLVTRDCIAAIRRRFPTTLIVAGGEHITAIPEHCLRECPEIDICVRGEGEHRFLLLLEAARQGQSIDAIEGIAFLDADNHYRAIGGLPRMRNIDQIPWPYWPPGYMEAFWKAGKSYGPQTERDMPMLITRGCPYRCTFCSNPNMWTTRYELRDPEDIVAEVKHYITHYHITAVQLYDLTAVVKRSWIVALLTKLDEQQIHVEWDFPAGTRSEALDAEVLSLLKKAGAKYLVYAPESGSPRVLKAIQKQVDLDKMIPSMRYAAKIGLVVRANIVIGFPCETRRDIFQTLWLVLKLIVLGIDEVQPYIFSPYPGSQLFRELLAQGRVALNEHYFLALANVNTDLFTLRPKTVNEHMRPWELALYRLLMVFFSYVVSYVLRPARIVRTLRNVKSDHNAANVFEHRLKDFYKRWTFHKSPETM